MAYVVESDLTGKIPPAYLAEALDDDSDGTADAGVLDQIIADADLEVDGRLGQRYNVPLADNSPGFTLAKLAAVTFVLEILYLRRGYHDEDRNPHRAAADRFRTKLDAIADGKEPLAPGADRAKTPVSVVSEPSKTQSTTDRLSS